MIRGIILFLSLSLIGCSPDRSEERIRVGTKTFTESVILGDMIRILLASGGAEVAFYPQLGGSRVLWNALTEDELDVYPDYTGTLINEILAESDIGDYDELKQQLNDMGIGISSPLGFNNTYAIGMKESLADSLQIYSISDLQNHPSLRFGFSNEFMERADGWPGLRDAYDLVDRSVIGLDHDLAYRGLENDDIQVIDLYSTDAEIRYYELRALRDDRGFFPDYQAVLLYRLDAAGDHAVLKKTIDLLEGSIDEKQMIRMNAAVKINGQDDSEVAGKFLEELGLEDQPEEILMESTIWSRLWDNTLGHLYLVGISLSLAILIAIPLGVLAVKVAFLENMVLSLTGIMQTIPSLALLVFMIPIFGIGSLPAMAALFLYSLLPIVRNTHSGINDISEELTDSAKAMGLPAMLILRKIELPLASASILAGIKTSAVINVGTATLGALIGAGGYGQPILTGIRLDDTSLILEGAIPAAILAMLVQFLFDGIEKWLDH